MWRAEASVRVARESVREEVASIGLVEWPKNRGMGRTRRRRKPPPPGTAAEMVDGHIGALVPVPGRPPILIWPASQGHLAIAMPNSPARQNKRLPLRLAARSGLASPFTTIETSLYK